MENSHIGGVGKWNVMKNSAMEIQNILKGYD